MENAKTIPSIRHGVAGIAIFISLILSAPAFAVIDVFLDAGEIHGEAQDMVHGGEIDVLAWSWSMSNSVVLVKGGEENNRPFFHGLSLTKWIDKSSPLLMSACAQGKPIPECTLTLRKAGGANPLEFLIITIRDVVVTSISTGGSGGEDRLTENVTLMFGWMSYTYTPQRPDGTPMDPIPFAWDILQNEPGL